MQQEVKEFREANPGMKFLDAASRTGFGAYRRRTFGCNSYNNGGFNDFNNNN
jgi:hypothetical protein